MIKVGLVNACSNELIRLDDVLSTLDEEIEFSKTNLTREEMIPYQLILLFNSGLPSKKNTLPAQVRRLIKKEFPGFGELIRQHTYKDKTIGALMDFPSGIHESTLLVSIPNTRIEAITSLKSLLPSIKSALFSVKGPRS